MFRATAQGVRENTAWLSSVVAHPRDARVDLLAKFVLRARRGLSNTTLAKRQLATFKPLEKRLRGRTSASDVVSLWRRESLDATMRVLRSIAR